MTLAAHWSALAAKTAIEEQTKKSVPEQDSDSSTSTPKWRP